MSAKRCAQLTKAAKKKRATVKTKRAAAACRKELARRKAAVKAKPKAKPTGAFAAPGAVPTLAPAAAAPAPAPAPEAVAAQPTPAAPFQPDTRTAPPHPVLALSFDEGDGSTVTDLSGNGNAGEVSGARWTQAGRFGGALAFDGDDSVTVPDAPTLDIAGAVSVSAWVRPRTLRAWQTVLMKEDEDENYAYTLYATSSGVSRPNGRFTHPGNVYGPSSLPVNTWSHLAITSDGGTARMYVDGVHVATSTSVHPMPDTALPLRIGNNSVFSDEGFDGLIDEVRVYDEQLTSAQVVLDRDTRVDTTTTDTAEPVLELGFDEGNGIVAAGPNGLDSSGFGVVRGARWSTTAVYGSSLLFDGVDDWVTVEDFDELDLRDEMTLEAWVRPRSHRAWQPLFHKEVSDTATWGHAYLLYATNNDPDGSTPAKRGMAAYTYDAVGEAETVAPPLPLGQWTHVAFTSDGVVGRIYANGVLVGTGAANVANATEGRLRIGGTQTWWPEEMFEGHIDEVRMYDKALTAAEVRRDRDTRIGAPDVG